MDTALSEISAFLRAIPPLDLLSPNCLEKLIKEISISYLRKNEPLPPSEITQPSIFIVRTGALCYQSSNKELLGKYGEGDICTVFCQSQPADNISVSTEEDTLLYSIPFDIFSETIKEHSDVSAFFEHSASERLSKKVNEINEDAVVNASLMNSAIEDFYHTPVATIRSQATIQQAAIMMTERGFSCLVITDEQETVGIITDKDIRRRCVAQGISFDRPVSDIMTADMTTLDLSSSAYDALMTMTSQRIHHLPITDAGKLAGMVTVTDLMNHEGNNAINITSMIHKASSVDVLAKTCQLLPKLQVRMAKLGTTADAVGKSISAITMACTIRLIELAQIEIGKAPVPFAWLAAGSQARQEQLAHSDQDNALIISDTLKTEDEAWFEKLAHFVCDGLATCGFIYCPGDIMATNNKWRQRQKKWHQYFDQWIERPDPKALLNSSVFFDLSTVYGEKSLLDEVRAKLLSKTQKHSLFIAHLSRNALMLKPPLGFFRDFVLIQDGDNKSTLDLKHNGIAPIVDLARIYALAEGISATNTIERLKLAAGTRSLTKSSGRNLIDAYQFLTMLRLQHQSQRLQQNQEPNNYLPPKSLSRLEREHLKDAFKVIKTLQDNRQATY